jgi:lipoprotein-anchoring transpeptidase ErfK/SrfK
MKPNNRARVRRLFPPAILAALLVAGLGPAGWSADNAGSAAPAAGATGAIPQDTRIVVNAPAFRMDLFEDGKLIKSYKIGIGYPEFPLPAGLRSADTIIISPTWTPPDETWVQSPKSKVKAGQKIAAGDKLNPLGPIKIPIGLPSLIHGGKAPGSIGGFASHGCVGLTNSQVEDFARQLARLSGTKISDEQIAEYEKNKTETRPVKLARAVPVELRYETITVENGTLHIYRDVYGRGTNTEENLRNVLQSYGLTLDQLSKSQNSRVMLALSQMARDAGGKPIASPAGTDKSKPKGGAGGNMTRTIRGRKEVAIPIAALKGKGYPAPVALDAGRASKGAPSHPRRRR